MLQRLSHKLRRIHQWLLPPELEVGATPYLWLIYFGFFYIYWIAQPPDLTELLLCLTTTAVFLAIYFSGFRRKGRSALVHCLAMTGLGLVWAPFNPGANVFFIYAASFAFLVGTPRQATALIASIMAMVVVMALKFELPFFFWGPAILIGFAVGISNISSSERERHNAALRLSQAEVRQLARVAERERIARDLHDVLGHSLTMIVVKAELAGRLFAVDPDRAREEIEAIETGARQSLSEVREAIGGYRERSLEGELEQARLALTSAGIDAAIRLDISPDLDSQTEAVLGLVIREAVTNTIRHARARHCRICLSMESPEGQVILEITDDGNGRLQPDGSGIDGMRARIEALGGHLAVKAPGGIHLRACFPVQTAA